jgi:hypothetical protein
LPRLEAAALAYMLGNLSSSFYKVERWFEFAYVYCFFDGGSICSLTEATCCSDVDGWQCACKELIFSGDDTDSAGMEAEISLIEKLPPHK